MFVWLRVSRPVLALDIVERALGVGMVHPISVFRSLCSVFPRPGGDLLSHALRRSTIGAEGFHGVSAKHLPRYGREWAYRFNRRRRIDDLGDFVLSRATARPTITYRQLIHGLQPNDALPALTG